MCIISDKIKFCTCATSNVNSLKHYWILHRFNKDKEEFCMGESLIPTSMLDINFKDNQETILNRLNEIDAFDISLDFQPKDVLEIVINNNSKIYDTFFYTFQFTDGKWVKKGHDPFEIMNHFDEKETGKIKNALKLK